MKTFFILILAGFVGACERIENDFTASASLLEALKDSVNWCGPNVKVALWGDSFVEGPGAVPLSTQLGAKMRKDMQVDNGLGKVLVHGDDIVANMGIGGEKSNQIRERFMADTIRRSWASIFWVGKNNAVDSSQVRADIDAMIATLPHNKYIVLGVMLSAYQKETKGTPYYTLVKAFNQVSAEKYGNHYIDPESILVANAGKSKGDQWAVANDCTPLSFLVHPATDSVHINSKAYDLISNAILSKLKRCY